MKEVSRTEEHKWRRESDRLQERLRNAEASVRAVEDPKMMWRGRYTEKVQELKHGGGGERLG